MSAKNQMQDKIPCVYMRGGTSKAVFFHKEDLPADESTWDELFLKVMGSPDVKQIDGMGGTVSSTSKIAVISKSQQPDTDVDFTFFQVAVDQASVVHNVSCGNIGSAVGPYAIDEGLVEAVEPETTVRIYNTNTKKYLEEVVQTYEGRACMYGDAQIQGVPGTGSPVQEIFLDPAGPVTGKLFPTGNAKDTLEVPGFGPLDVTVIDSGTLVVLLKAESIGLTGREQQELNGNAEKMELLETVRGMIAQKVGLVGDWRLARKESPAAPDLAFLSKPQDYEALGGGDVKAESMDLCVRALSMGKVHKAYPITVTVATTSAAALPGTVAAELLPAKKWETIRLGHASGVMDVHVKEADGKIEKVGVLRTARRIMDGNVYVR